MLVSDVICGSQTYDNIVTNEKSVYGVTNAFINEHNIRAAYKATTAKAVQEIIGTDWRILLGEYENRLRALKGHGISEKTIIRTLKGYDVEHERNAFNVGASSVKNALQFMLFMFQADPQNDVNCYNRR